MSLLGVPLHTLEFLVWIILGAQSNLLNKLMMIWLSVFSKICGSQAQNSKRVFQDSVLKNFPPNGRRWQQQWPVCGAQQGRHKRPLQRFCLGDGSFSECLGLEQGSAFRVRAAPGPPGGPAGIQCSHCWVFRSGWWALPGGHLRAHRALQPPWAAVRGCFCRVSGQRGAPRRPQLSLGSVCSRFTQRRQEHHPPRAGLQVCTQRRCPVQGLGAGLGG